jgi:hypothetical protein
VGAGAVIHGCTIESNAHIGAGAQVMDGAVVEAHAVVSPGALVGAKKRVPAGQIWAGMPATFKDHRSISCVSKQREIVSENQALGVQYELEVAKSFEAIETDLYDYEQKHDRSEYYYQQISKEVPFICSAVISVWYFIRYIFSVGNRSFRKKLENSRIMQFLVVY